MTVVKVGFLISDIREGWLSNDYDTPVQDGFIMINDLSVTVCHYLERMFSLSIYIISVYEILRFL